MKIGIYGGSFNPPHLGHMAAAESAAKYLGLDELLLIPAGIPPHKMLSADAAGADDRLAMTRLMGEQIALDTGVKVTVSDMEIARGGKSYTADTLRILHEEHPDDELWLLMGSDMVLTFQYWYKPDEIVRYAGLCAFGRTEKDGEELFAPQRKYLGQRFPGSRIVTMTLPNLVDVSSTELRARIPKRETDGLLAPAVLGYIYRKHLYGTNLDLKRLTLEDLRPIALSYLKAKRIPHVLGTEQTAEALAEKYGADVEKARFAALLHDSTKRLSMEEQLAMCEHYHIELDELEKKALKLLHAKTGAALARDVFGADDEIYNAILWHTTGKANMTLLEKVIYLADYIEPNRDFDGVENLRKVVWEDLDKGLEMGLAMTVEEMEKALQYGADIVTDCYNEGCNVISFGEMGIGNTAASSMWMTCLTQIPLIDCVGAGSGLDSEGVRHKYNVLKRSLENYKGDGSALDVMRYFGGYEMVMAVGGMLRAAELKMIILVDGFIMTNCVLVASRLYPEMQSYCVFGHCGDEAGHKRVLDFLGAKALLDLGLRLGEGSGSVCAYPILDSAVRMINEMHSFKQAAITKYF